MSFLELVPAKELAASYFPWTQTLKLDALIVVKNFAYDFQFRRGPWLGGLKFDLQAWSGPYGLGIEEQHQYSQDFDMPNLNHVDPSGYVIIVTQNHPKGVRVPIRWMGYREPDDGGDDDLLGAAATESVSKLTAADEPSPVIHSAQPVPVVAMVGLPFTINALVPDSASASVDMQYNRLTLTLANAGIELGKLLWTFDPLVLGKTYVVVTAIPNLGGPIVRTFYIVDVVRRGDNGLAPKAALSFISVSAPAALPTLNPPTAAASPAAAP